MAAANLHDLASPAETHFVGGRVVEGRLDVEQFRMVAFESNLEQLGPDPLVVDRNTDDPRAERVQHAQRTGVGRLIDEHGVTHQELAERVGLNRSSVSNLLRLNELDEFARGAVRSGRLGLGHAKALLSVGDPAARRRLAELAIRQSLSIRALERRAARLNGDGHRAARADGHRAARSGHEALARQIGEQLGTRVHIQPGKTKGSGRLVIEFYSLDQFDGLIQRMGVEVG